MSLQTNVNGKWEDCELGKKVGEKYVVYIGDTYACVHEDQLRDKPQKFNKTVYFLLHINGSIDFTWNKPVFARNNNIQVRQIEIEWEA